MFKKNTLVGSKILFVSVGLLLIMICNHSVRAAPIPASAYPRIMLNGVAYGAGGGALMGALMWVISGRGKSVIYGASAGVFVGFAAAIAHISFADSPHNPLRDRYACRDFVRQDFYEVRMHYDTQSFFQVDVYRF